MIAVSACLVGKNVKYNGKNNYNTYVLKYLENKPYILICPETLGLLPTPRCPSEIKGSKVYSKDGKDVTNNFILGANKALNIILENNVDEIILKANSPSCGYKKIYDGSFNGTLIDGNGIFVQLVIKKNIKIYTEKDIERKYEKN